MKVRVSANDKSISDYCLTTIVGHNARLSCAVDKLCMVAATDAKLQDEDGGPIHPKQQHAHWTCRVLLKCKRNDVGDEESHTNDNDFAMSGEASEDSPSDDESVIISDVEVCSKVLDQHIHL